MAFIRSVLVLTLSTVAFSVYNSSGHINSLLDSAKYDRRIRPYHMNSTLNVTVFITIVSFGDVAEMRNEFSLDMFFGQIWKDPRLRHNDQEGIVLSGKYDHLVWLPDTFFVNIKEGKLHDVPTDISRVIIERDGTVQYSTRITLTASCEMDLHRYPLDTQICLLQIMSYSYPQKEIDYRWKGNRDTALLLMNDHLAQLDLEDYDIGKETKIFAATSEPYTELTVTFKFKRRIGYSLLQIYFPTFLIVCLSWLSFWISKDSIPARIALGITTILTLVTLSGSNGAVVPKVSYIKAMDLYVIVSFFFVFGAVMEYIAVLTYDEFLKEKQARAKKHDQSNDDETPREKFTIEEPVNGIIAKKHKHRALLRRIISINSTPIDTTSKVAFPACYALFNVVYWSYFIIYSV